MESHRVTYNPPVFIKHTSPKVLSYTVCLCSHRYLFIFSQKYWGYYSPIHLLNQQVLNILFVLTVKIRGKMDTGSKVKAQIFTKRIGNVKKKRFFSDHRYWVSRASEPASGAAELATQAGAPGGLWLWWILCTWFPVLVSRNLILLLPWEWFYLTRTNTS